MIKGRSENRFLILCIGILCLILLSPLLGSEFRVALLIDFFYSFLFISCVFAVSSNKKYTIFSTLFGLPFLVLTWGSHFYTFPHTVVIVCSFSGIIFIGSIIYMIFKHVLRQNKVSLEVIYGAIVVYLLLGIFCALCYGIIDRLDPNGFYYGNEFIGDSRMRFLYFSYVTLTTLGYGDITPVAPVARSLAMLEAIIGQIYLVVMIAWLVGMNVAQSLGENKKQDM
jgi:voltage-gated potassium channel